MTDRKFERRRAHRESLGNHGIALARVRPGHDVAVLDVSAGGTLVEGRYRLLPGTRVELQLQSGERRVSIRGVVLRCAVSRVRPTSVCYCGAIGFDRPLSWFHDGDAEEYAVPAEGRPTHPFRAAATHSML